MPTLMAAGGSVFVPTRNSLDALSVNSNSSPKNCGSGIVYTHGREHIEVTQKQLATFRRDNAEIETILRQQRHDRETRAALVVLEGGKKSPTRPPTEPHQAEEGKVKREQEAPEKTKKINPYKNLLVLRRIEL